MNIRRLALILFGAAVLAGCASAGAISSLSSGKPPAATSSMTPGMVMPDGSTMGATTTVAPPASSTAGQASASALMVCSDDIKSTLAKVLAVPSVPAGTSSWANQLYTCTYQLPMGALVLSVKDTADASTTDAYYTALRQQLGTTKDLAGLGQAAYGTDTGTVVLRKDDHVLRVDATALPAQFGSQEQKRNDFAYEIASDILGCWTGD